MTSEPRIIVAKGARRLSLLSGSGVERTYAIALGRNSAADKAVEGDEATPVGEFYICAKNPRSRYFLSLCISYPNAEDAERGLAAGLIGAAEHRQILEALRARRMPPQHTQLGGEIYIHGHGGAHGRDAVQGHGAMQGQDVRGEPPGTRGCIALNDADMLELYQRVMIGTPVTIDP